MKTSLFFSGEHPMRSIDFSQPLFYKYRGFNRATFLKSIMESRRFCQTLYNSGDNTVEDAVVEEPSHSAPINNKIFFPAVFLNETNEFKGAFTNYNSFQDYQRFSGLFEKYNQIDIYA